jgi:hypothetical protein
VAREIRGYDVTIPAGTTPAAPVTIDVSYEASITEAVEWSVPKGPAGLMGFRLTSGGAQVIPHNLGSWIIANGQNAHWPLEELHTSGSWQVTGYNTGSFPHIVRVRFHVSPIGKSADSGEPFGWLLAGKLTRSMVELGTLSNAPDTVRVPSSLLWPPRSR